jgi:hypothetical protein
LNRVHQLPEADSAVRLPAGAARLLRHDRCRHHRQGGSTRCCSFGVSRITSSQVMSHVDTFVLTGYRNCVIFLCSVIRLAVLKIDPEPPGENQISRAQRGSPHRILVRTLLQV